MIFQGPYALGKVKKDICYWCFLHFFLNPLSSPLASLCLQSQESKKKKNRLSMGGVFLPWPAPSKHGLRVQTLPVFLPQCSCTYLEERRNIVELFAVIASVRPSNEITYNISQKLAEVSSF